MLGKYDDFEYHVGSAVDAGFPPENAFTHIGFLVSWLIRHGLFRAEFISPKAGGDLASGKLRPNDLRDYVDGKLVDAMLTPIGSAFLGASYETYVTEYAEAFSDRPEYGVTDDPANQAIADRVIDATFAQWTAAGGLDRKDDTPELPELPELTFEYSGPPELMAGIELPPGIEVVEVDRHAHFDTELERRIAAAIPLPLDTDSWNGSQWGSSTLVRQARELGVKTKDVTVASGMAKDADPSLTVVRVPGVDRARLFEAFRQDRSYGLELDWQPCEIAGYVGLTCTQKLTGLPLNRSIWFAMDEYSVDIGGNADDPHWFEFAESLARALAG